MAKKTKKQTPAQRRDAHDKPREVDSFKRLHVAIALAPTFARHALIEGSEFTAGECETTANQIHRLATAIARKL